MKLSNEELLKNFSEQDIGVIHLTVIATAVEALIATHPNPDEVKKVFDLLMGQQSATLIVQGAPLDAFEVARRFGNSLFHN